MHSKPSGTAARVGLCIILLLLGLVVAGTATAAWISMGAAEGSPVGVRVLDSSPDRVVVEYTIGGFYADPVVINGATYYRISLPQEGRLLDAGNPELPHVARSVIVSDVARMDVHVLDSETSDFPGLPVAPSKGNLLRTSNPAQVPFTFGSLYGSDRWYPEATASGGEPYILRDYRGMVIDAFPFRAHGSDGTLRVARRLVIEAVANGPSTTNVLHRSGPPASVAEAFRPLYANQFANYGQDRYTPVPDHGRMLVITYDGFRDAMSPFVSWKTQAGIPVQIVNVSTIGNNATSIKNYISSLYNSPQGLAFVLLVGDGNQVATGQLSGGSSDAYYSLMTSDHYPDLLVGRFSAETVAQAQTQVQRSVTYEQNPTAGGAWYPKGTGIGSDQGPGDDGEYDYQHIDNIRTKLMNYGYTLVDQIYDPGATSTMVANALNNGRSVLNYCGHGSQTSWGTTGFSNNNVNQLTNDWMLPFLFSVACVNGQFEGATCFAEAWMRATHNGNPTGAIATYMSSINQSWNPPMAAEDGFDDALVADMTHTLGALYFDGSCKMMDKYPGANGYDMFNTWIVFGDPSLLVRTKTPAEMTVQHAGVYQIGQGTYSVTVAGVAGALCALSANGVLYGSAYTDPTGLATLTLDPPPTQEMTLTLTVTAYNKVPSTSAVQVLPPTDANVQFLSDTIADSAGGDGDGVPDAGETIDVTLTLENTGTDPANGVTATIVNSDPYVTVLNDTESYGDIPAGGTAAGQGAYRISFAPGTPDNHQVALSLTINAEVGRWASGFEIPVCRPALSCAGQHADDSLPLGNGSGWLTPGETFDLSLVLGNAGHANARNIVANAVSTNLYIEIVNGRGTLSGVDAGGQGTTTPLRLRVRPICPTPSIQTLRVNLTGDFGYSGSIQVPIQIGGFTDDLEADRGWTVGAPGDSASQGAWLRSDPVGTMYGGHVVQPEDDHTSAPGTNCYVTGNGRVGGPADSSCVRGGKTTLLSPVFDLHAVNSATVDYWFWYTNDFGSDPGVGVWDVEVTPDGGQTWVPLEQTTTSTDAWTHRTFALSQFVPLTGQVQLRFVASDYTGTALVEGLVDDFVLSITEGVSTGVEGVGERLDFAIDRVSPNPASGPAEIRYRAPGETAVDLSVYDVAGRLVRTLHGGPVSAGEHQMKWDRKSNTGVRVGAGIYFVRMTARGFSQVRQVTLIN